MGRHDLGTRFDVAAVEQGVAEGLGWGSAKAGVFLWELTRCIFTGFFFDENNSRSFQATSRAVVNLVS